MVDWKELQMSSLLRRSFILANLIIHSCALLSFSGFLAEYFSTTLGLHWYKADENQTRLTL